ncbi:Uncharacterised protein [Klebsiella pneumoniae]|nr:Uncharacterised protein [Klebsiella pneumoniae]
MLPEHQNQVPQDTTNTPDFTGKQSDNPEFEEVEEDLSKEILNIRMLFRVCSTGLKFKKSLLLTTHFKARYLLHIFYVGIRKSYLMPPSVSFN